MRESINIVKSDVEPLLYFIISMTQERDHAMHGSMTSKNDLLGGIIDRWINRLPEMVVFDKILLKDKAYQAVYDYFIYTIQPGYIAPDVLGIKTENKTIPFALCDNCKWLPVDNMPQIEVKTLKKNQKMVTLKDFEIKPNQYFVLAETDFGVSYLLPFFDKMVFDKNVYNNIQMDYDAFVVSNSEKDILQPKKVDINNETLGTISLLTVTTVREFSKFATYCGKGIDICYVGNIDVKQSMRGANISKSINECFEYNAETNLFNYKHRWNANQFNSIGTYFSDAEALEVVKENQNSYYLYAKRDCIVNAVKLQAGQYAQISLASLGRSKSASAEWFIQKELLYLVKDYSNELVSFLDDIAINS